MTAYRDFDPAFRHVRLLLARDSRHPAGDREEGYDLLVPLDREGRIDPTAWKKHRQQCRVRHFGPDGEERVGHLRRKPGGQWFVDYAEGEEDDEACFRFGDERFVAGEYVSIGRAPQMRTYQIARVAAP
jgi:hypothetical protein